MPLSLLIPECPCGPASQHQSAHRASASLTTAQWAKHGSATLNPTQAQHCQLNMENSAQLRTEHGQLNMENSAQYQTEHGRLNSTELSMAN